MRLYVPEKPLFRWYLKKLDCQVLTIPSAIDLSRPAPQSGDDLRREQQAKQTAQQTKAAQPNARAHHFLDQVEAVQKWWAASPPDKPAVASSPPTPAAAKEKPLEPFDLQDVPSTEESHGYQLDPALMRQWFMHPAYAVESIAQKECLTGAPFYPAALVNSTTLRLTDLLKTVERIQLAHDRIKSREFLDSPPVRAALHKVCSRLPEGYGYDLQPSKEFNGDLQRMHRKYAFASITVGQRFPQDLEDIRVQALDKSRLGTDDVALALGAFKLYAAIEDAHVFYNGRTTRRVQVKEISIYIMAPYGFDALEQGMAYRGHFNKKHFALVTNGDWVNAPVFVGRDMYARNSVLRPVATQQFMQWRERHGKGADMLLFSERRPSFPYIDVEVPLRAIAPRFALLGRIAGDEFGRVGRPHIDVHFTLAMFDTEWGTVCIDGQPTMLEAGIANAKLIRSNFYYGTLPTKIELEQPIAPPQGMEPEEFARRLYENAQSFANYTEDYSLPAKISGSQMNTGEYNSNSYIAGLLSSVMGHTPRLNLQAQNGRQFQAPGYESPMPGSCFRGK